MDLSVIIINYKSANHVLNCIKSIYEQTHEHSFEIIVVDNRSGDDSESVIRTAYPEIIWIQTGYNAGFARANNAGIRRAKGDLILLLNADTIVLNNALDTTIELFQQKTDAVACGVQLLNEDGTHQISGAHFKKGGLNLLLPLPYLGNWVRSVGYKMQTKIPSVQTVSADMEVDWIVGAFIMVKKTVLDKAGLLNEDFFMYAEEIEWCSRLRKHGKLYLFAEPKIIHLGGGTSGGYYNTSENENSKNLWNKKGRQIMVSQMLRVRKQYGLLWYFLLVALFVVEIPLFAIGLFIEKAGKSKSKYSWDNLKGYIKNICVLLRYFFRIAVNKPFFYKVY